MNGGGNGRERGGFRGLAWGSAILEAAVPKNKTPRRIHSSSPISRKDLQTAVNSEKRVQNSRKARKTPKCRKHVGIGENFDRNTQRQTFLSKKEELAFLH